MLTFKFEIDTVRHGASSTNMPFLEVVSVTTILILSCYNFLGISSLRFSRNISVKMLIAELVSAIITTCPNHSNRSDSMLRVKSDSFQHISHFSIEISG
jgi:uncharacterized membrane protein